MMEEYFLRGKSLEERYAIFEKLQGEYVFMRSNWSRDFNWKGKVERLTEIKSKMFYVCLSQKNGKKEEVIRLSAPNIGCVRINSY